MSLKVVSSSLSCCSKAGSADNNPSNFFFDFPLRKPYFAWQGWMFKAIENTSYCYFPYKQESSYGDVHIRQIRGYIMSRIKN